MTAGNLSLNFTAPGTFTATVTAPPGYTLMCVNLSSPTGTPFPMMNMSGGANPSTWQYVAAAVGGVPGGPLPSPGGVPSGTWTATAMLQAMAQCFGTTNV